MGMDRVDFFVSHAGADRAWAEWIAWQLIDAGYTVELDVWDWAAGRNFVTAMSDALDRANRVVALISVAYFDRSRYTTEEFSAAMLHVPDLEDGRLVPVRVEEVHATEMPAVLRSRVFCDVFGVEEEAARQNLLAAATGPRRPNSPPGFPGHPGGLSRLGGAGPRRPGTRPLVWGNVPARNPGFTGRDGLLVRMRERLLRGDRAVVQALHGMSGVGKTQLAAEYAHRFANGYDVVWWISGDQAGLIGDQVTALAAELGCAPPDADTKSASRAVMAELRARSRWLLVFDDAQQPEDLKSWLPGSSAGHVLITSRLKDWTEIAGTIEIGVFARTESVALLRTRVDALTEQDANRLAEALGDLPLGVAQAAGYLAATGMSIGEYLDLLGTRATEILGEGRPMSYQLPLAAVTRLAADRLGGEDPAAAELVTICAFLAPEPVPITLFTGHAEQLPDSLAAKAADPVAFGRLLSVIGRDALARIDSDGLQLHQLTQAILRDELTPSRSAATRACAEAVLAANHPGSAEDPANWPAWARMLPHLLSVDPAATTNAALRDAARDAAWYLLARGDTRSGHDLARNLYQQWRDRLGPADHHSWSAANSLAESFRQMGRYADAQQLDEDTLTNVRGILGDDHPSTLISASNLAADLRRLGQLQAARELDEDTLARERRIHGDDHPGTLSSANNLAVDLHQLGEIQAARELDENTLARRRRVLGDDHPATLRSANNLAGDLRELGEIRAARELDEDTLARRRRVLGADHPDVLISVSNLAADLRALGETQAARELDEDTLARFRRVLGSDHPSTLTCASDLAADLRALGEYQAALELDEDTVARRRRKLGADHPDVLTSVSNVAADRRALEKT
jgi:TIR domain/Tetratricopeptide repeat/NB-ARC domain